MMIYGPSAYGTSATSYQNKSTQVSNATPPKSSETPAPERSANCTSAVNANGASDTIKAMGT